MGHTDATFDEARRGFEFGATHATHTFNAMRGLHHREAGMVGYALLSSDLVCELIYDRHHVCEEAARLLMKGASPEQIVAVSDSTMATGMPPGTVLEMWGLKCFTGKDEVRLADSGALAGSAITLHDAFLNIWEDFGVDVAIRTCSLNPRRALRSQERVRTYLEFDRDRKIREIRRLPLQNA
jgi:N-acetylglucosamine-6-phosphate deacetylase